MRDHTRIGCGAGIFALLAVTNSVGLPPAHATETVRYEIVSDTIGVVDVEYVDGSGRHLVTDVALPWRLDVTLADPRGPTGEGAQLRADWRPLRDLREKWVTVRILAAGELLCQSTLDVGNATCYGNTSHFS